MAVGIFAITVDTNKVENWGFHHSMEDREGHPEISNFIGQYID
jgi:hypothetical protein